VTFAWFSTWMGNHDILMWRAKTKKGRQAAGNGEGAANKGSGKQGRGKR